MKSLIAFVSRRPWILVVLAFLILIAAWSTLITIVSKNPAEVIEVKKHQVPGDAGLEKPILPSSNDK